MQSAYFDSSVFLAIIGNEGTVPKIRLLIRELKKQKVRIVTSIITVQEVSVKTFQKGRAAKDNYALVSKLARVLSIDKEIALTAAKYEAHILDGFKGSEEQKASENKRRKMDCFHIACAVVNEVGTLYSLDEGMLNRQRQFKLPGIAFLKPEPSELMLDLQPSGAAPRAEAVQPQTPAPAAIPNTEPPPEKPAVGSKVPTTEKPEAIPPPNEQPVQ